jgi:hypothetical protein
VEKRIADTHCSILIIRTKLILFLERQAAADFIFLLFLLFLLSLIMTKQKIVTADLEHVGNRSTTKHLFRSD